MNLAGRALLWLAPLALLSTLTLQARADVESRSFTETFDTRQFEGFNSPAVWDTVAGELTMLPFELIERGSYDTAGDAQNVAVEGDLAYVADGTGGVVVLNVRYTTPSLVSTYDTPGEAAAIDVDGDLVFVADKGSGLTILNVSNPAAPTLVTSYATGGFAFDVAVSGTHAFVANNNQDVAVIDVTNPAAPALVSTLPTTNFAQGLTVEGSLVFVADGYSGLAIFDVSDPASPTTVSTLDTSGFARNVAVSGNIAYLADFSDGLKVIDVTFPAAPVALASFSTAQSTVGVFVDGDWLYLASTSAVFVLDVSDPAAPVQVHSWASAGEAEAIVVDGEHAYVANGTVGGVQVLDIGDLLKAPFEVYTYSVDLTCTPVVSGNFAYSARRAGFPLPTGHEIVTWDVSDPSRPAFRGTRSIVDIAVDMAIDGDRLYVALGNSGLGVYGIGSPTNPSGGSVLDPGQYFQEVAVSGRTVFASTFEGWLYSIAATTSYSVLDTYQLPSAALDLVLEGNFLYAPCFDSGLQVFDVRNPASVTLVGQYVPPESVLSVDVVGDFAYVACTDGLHVLSVYDPASPTLLDLVLTSDAPSAVAVVGNHAIVATLTGLEVVNITNPSSSVRAGRVTADLRPREMSVYGDYLMVGEASFSQGMSIFRVVDRVYDNTRNIGYSRVVAFTPSDIHRARIVSDQDDGVYWSLSVDGGFEFESIPERGVWTELFYSNSRLAWLATLVPALSDVAPTVREVTIDWLYEHAVIESITDVPGDQGGFARLNFTRSGHDFADESTYPASSYDIYRRVDDPQLKEAVSKAGGQQPMRSSTSASQHPGIPRLRLAGRDFVESSQAKAAGFPPGTWEAVASLGALQSNAYLSLVPTIADSSTTLQQTVYTIVTQTTTPSVWYVSPPDSGYSVDNIAPGVPQGMSATYSESGADLDWLASPEPDFQYFRVYRGPNDDFVPSLANLVHSTATPGWTDPVANSWRFRYKVTALDHAGNESEPASPGAVTAVEPPDVPTRFALHPNVPNPFNPRTLIEYDVPAGRHRVRLVVYDAAGRVVRTLVNEAQEAGLRSAVFDGTDDAGRPVASGMYFYRLEAADVKLTRKMVLLR